MVYVAFLTIYIIIWAEAFLFVTKVRLIVFLFKLIHPLQNIDLATWRMVMFMFYVARSDHFNALEEF